MNVPRARAYLTKGFIPANITKKMIIVMYKERI